ncbi:MAG: hypothetical protein K2N58_06430 [Treponemataceae bacterium]|nr:hypothetical protein [Treponemataceae bacterium]
MKKLIGTAMLAALLATSAFAELNMGAWLRTLVAPVAYNGDEIQAGWENSWGYGIRNARISFNFTSDDEKVGMMYDVFGDGASGFGSGDYRAMWFQPVDWFKAMVGHIDNGYAMRGDLCYGSWAWLRPNNWFERDEGLTFNLGNRDGLQLEFFPVDGLQILAHLSLPWDGGFAKFSDQIKNSLIGVSYTIGDFATIKVAYLGGYSDKDKDSAGTWTPTGKPGWHYKKDGKEASFDNDGKFYEALLNGEIEYWNPGIWAPFGGAQKTFGNAQIGFDLKGVENLWLTVGARVQLVDKYYKGNEMAKVAAGASYQITDSFGLSVSAAALLLKEISPKIQAGVGVNVGLTDVLGLEADVRWLGDLEASEHCISFCVGLNWAMSSNGSLGIGFQGTTNGNGFAAGDTALSAAKSDAFCFAVPVRFGLWF